LAPGSPASPACFAAAGWVAGGPAVARTARERDWAGADAAPSKTEPAATAAHSVRCMNVMDNSKDK
jgi:hypothetical protein